MPRGQNLPKVRGSKEQLAARFGVKPLEPHEAARLVWVRARAQALTEFEALNASERGRLLERALRLRTLYIAQAGEDILLAYSMAELHERARAAGLEVSKVWVRDLP